MAKDSQRLEQEFIANAQTTTGRTVPQWLAVIQQATLDEKSNVILKWLKDAHQLNHLQANFLAGIYLNGGEPVYNHEVLFARLFADKAHLKPVYEALERATQQRLADAEFIPTKAYVSIEAKRCFACATLTRQNIRVGLDLGSTPFDAYVQKAKSLGAMPNLTHMVEITEVAQVDDTLLGYMVAAHRNAHQK
jgi:hypothetical protein